jgi:hypothetical protein
MVARIRQPVRTSIQPTLSPQYGTPEGRIPFGDGSSGWYHTPETIEPTDCVNYPNSPWCGGNPLSTRPIGLDIQINVNPCGLDIDIRPTLFIKLPVHGISYRLPGDCRNDPPPKTEPTPQPGQINYEGFDIAVDSKSQVFAFITNSQNAAYTYTNPWGCGNLSGISFATPEGWVSSCGNFRCPGDKMTVSGSLQQTPVGCDWKYEVYATGFKTNIPHPYISGTYCSDQSYRDSSVSTSPANYNTGAYIFTYIHDEAGNIRQWKTNDGQTSTINYSIPATYETSYCEPYRGMPLRIWKGYYRHIKFFVAQPKTIEAYKTVTVKLEYVVGVNCSYPIITPYDKNHPPLPLPKKDCCMTCCTPTTQQNDNTALLQKILAEIQKANKNLGTYPFNATLFDADENQQEAQSKTIAITTVANGIKNTLDRVEKTSKMIGIDAFPITLPDTIIEEPEKGLLGSALSFLNPFKDRTIHSIAELIAWKIEQDSAVMGHWHQFIEMETSTTDPKTGKTSTKNEKIVLPNMSQTMKELVVMNSQGMKITGLILDCCIKLLIEVAGTKLKAAEAAKRAEDLQQYMDYPTTEKWMDVPLQTDMPKSTDSQEKRENLHQFLQPSHAKVKFDDCTGEHSLQEAIIDLLNAARTIQAVYFSGQ